MRTLRARLTPALLAAALAATACGGKSAPATATTEHGHAGHHGDAPHEHDFPPEVAAFHDTLAPLWHATPGAQRTEDTCTATGELDQRAEHLQNAAPPAGVDADAWAEKLAALREVLSDLSDDCVADRLDTFEADFTALHDAFHALIALLPGGGMKHP